MNYERWLKTVPAAIQGDPLWKVEAYRLSLIPDQRNFSLPEDSVPYECSTENRSGWSSDELAGLLKEVPLRELTHHASLVTPP
jgi:hypothetical protein